MPMPTSENIRGSARIATLQVIMVTARENDRRHAHIALTYVASHSGCGQRGMHPRLNK